MSFVGPRLYERTLPCQVRGGRPRPSPAGPAPQLRWLADKPPIPQSSAKPSGPRSSGPPASAPPPRAGVLSVVPIAIHPASRRMLPSSPERMRQGDEGAGETRCYCTPKPHLCGRAVRQDGASAAKVHQLSRAAGRWVQPAAEVLDARLLPRRLDTRRLAHYAEACS